MNLLNGYGYVPPSPQKRSRHWAWWLAGFSTTAAALISVIAVGFAAWALYTPLSVKDDAERIFTVQKGEGVSTIARHLQDEGYLRSQKLFSYYAYLKGYGTRLQAGEYAISRDMNIPEIIDVLVRGRIVLSDISVTFPEGFTVRDMDRTLSEKNLVERGVFAGVADIWEGYLFPDTYNFQKNTTATAVRDALLANFKKKFTSTMRKDAALQLQKIKNRHEGSVDQCYSLELVGQEDEESCPGDDIVILASLVEKEVQTQDDMKVVSGILWKRMALGIPLQVDATIVHLTGKKPGQITYDDLKIASLYNTYLHRGLPPTPIANPGLNAILAAIYPEESPYLYYLSKPTGETVFSKTLEEHNAAKAKYLK